MAQDVPFYPRSTSADQDVGGINQDFRALAISPNRPRDRTDTGPVQAGLSNTTCSAGSYLNSATVSGGLVTAGTCTALPSNATVGIGSATWTATQDISVSAQTTLNNSTVSFSVQTLNDAVLCTADISWQAITVSGDLLAIRICEGGTTTTAGCSGISVGAGGSGVTVSYGDTHLTILTNKLAAVSHSFYVQGGAYPNLDTVRVNGGGWTSSLNCFELGNAK